MVKKGDLIKFNFTTSSNKYYGIVMDVNRKKELVRILWQGNSILGWCSIANITVVNKDGSR